MVSSEYGVDRIRPARKTKTTQTMRMFLMTNKYSDELKNSWPGKKSTLDLSVLPHSPRGLNGLILE